MLLWRECFGLTCGCTRSCAAGGQLCFEWDAPADSGGANVTGYRVFLASPGSTRESCDDVSDTACQHVGTTGNGTRSFCHSGRAPSTTYQYRIAATNVAGAGYASHAADLSTSIATPPAAPSTPALDAATSTSLQFHWQAPADDGGLSITEYDVEYGKLGQRECVCCNNPRSCT